MKTCPYHLLVGSLFAFTQFACSSDAGSPSDNTQVGGATAQPGTTTSPTGLGGQSALQSSQAPIGGGAKGGASGLGTADTQGGAGGSGGTTGANDTTNAGGNLAASSGGTTAKSTNTAKGGTTSSGGSTAKGGTTSTGGTTAKSTSTAKGGTTSTGGTTAKSTSTAVSGLANFSFFVTSQAALIPLSGNANGFGGDLRYGMTDGLSGADKICTTIAEQSMPGAGAKQWRAFLSVTASAPGGAVNAIDRIGTGPWYDRLGRLVANNTTELLNARPPAADAVIKNDLPNETGTPNSTPNLTKVDNHDTLTGSNTSGQIGSTTRANTCNDWTSVSASGKPQIGHSWPRTANSATNWMSDHTAPGCAAGINTGSQNGTGSCVGCSGGYGGIYCFALSP